MNIHVVYKRVTEFIIHDERKYVYSKEFGNKFIKKNSNLRYIENKA